jgi:NitT/TauT family transport system substrate-binding protein
MRKFFKSIRSIGVTLVCIGLLAACAGKTSVPAQQSQTPVTLNLQWFPQAQFAGYYVALDKGWYSEVGIDLNIRPGGPDISTINLVRNGSAQFGTSLLADIIVAIEKKNDLISIAQIQQTNGLLLIARKDSGIKGPKDFAGKKVGIWLGNWEAQFDALIAKEGITPNDFTLISQGFSMDAFIDGKLDVASAMIYNEYYTVVESGLKPEDITIINYTDYGLGFPGDVLFTSTQIAKDNPDLCVRMLRASLRGWQYAIVHPEEAADIVLKYDPSKTQTRQHQITMMYEVAKLVQVNIKPIGYTDYADVRRAIDTLYTYKVLTTQPSPDLIFTNSFWEQAQSPK